MPSHNVIEYMLNKNSFPTSFFSSLWTFDVDIFHIFKKIKQKLCFPLQKDGNFMRFKLTRTLCLINLWIFSTEHFAFGHKIAERITKKCRGGGWKLTASEQKENMPFISQHDIIVSS